MSAEAYIRALKTGRFVQHDVRRGIPFPDNSVDYFFTSHLLDCVTAADGERLLREAWRALRPGGRIRLSACDMEIVIALYQEGRKAVALAQLFEPADSPGNTRYTIYDYPLLERILAAPSFLFGVETVPANAKTGSAYRLSDLDVASRLSFFLWSSVPDEELLNLATHGRLKDPKVLEQQVQRMLHDARSQALVDGFANRWLGLSKLAGIVPDTDLYREFDESLREVMAKETQLFVDSQLQENRSVVELVTANYTFVNERLARHYGIPNIYGPRFRRVQFADGVRGGLLGQASVLAVTSYPNRTSVTLRGRWLLANLLGAPPPPPPPDVPALKDPGQDGQPQSLRKRMEIHRQFAVCASCHQRMDPLGFSLENFDALGKWRAESDGAPIDAAASLPDGTRFEGIAGLRQLIGSHQEDFVRTFTEKLLAYAIGRGIEPSDYPAIRKISHDAAAQEYRWSSIIWGIVNSPAFNMGVGTSDKVLAARN